MWIFGARGTFRVLPDNMSALGVRYTFGIYEFAEEFGFVTAQYSKYTISEKFERIMVR